MKENTKSNDFFQNKGMYGGTIRLLGNDIGFLLLHGFTATTAEVSKLGGHIIGKGFSVLAPILPGHNTSPYDLNATKFQEWIECAEDAYAELKAECRKVIVCGESMGGVLSLYLAENHPEISALVLFSTALLVKRLKLARFIMHFQPLKEKKLPDDDLPWQGYTMYPTKAAHQLYLLTRLVKKRLKNIISPTLLFQGDYDRTIDAENINFIYENISSNPKKDVRLEHSGHVMLLDQELPKIISLMDQFLRENQILDGTTGL